MDAATTYFATKAHLLPSFKEIGLLINKNKRAAAITAGLRGSATSCIDQDDSGTYDPKLERRTPPRVRRTWLRKLNDNEGEADKEQQRRWRPPKGYGLLITFYFTQHRAISYLHSIAPRPDQVANHIIDLAANSDNGPRSKSTDQSIESGRILRRHEIGRSKHDFKSSSKDSCEESLVDGRVCTPGLLDSSTSLAKRLLRAEEIPKAKERSSQTYHEDQVKIEEQILRRFVSCNQCREAGSRCSLKSKQENGPCTKCKATKDCCYFLRPYPAKHETDSYKPKSRSPSKHLLGTPNRLRGNVKRLQKKSQVTLEPLVKRETAFIHPIRFNYVPKSGCDFHTSIFYGLSGFEPRQISGRWLPNGGGFEEKIDGNNSNTVKYQVCENTKMCVDCTTARIIIISCPCNNVMPLTAEEQNPLVHCKHKLELALSACLAGDEDGAGALVTNAKFCSICPTPATHQCQEKCGLLLCDICTGYLLGIKQANVGGVNHVEEYQIVDYIIKEAKRMAYKHPSGLRADAEFLTNDGELLYRIDSGMMVGVTSSDNLQSGHAIDVANLPVTQSNELEAEPHNQIKAAKSNLERQEETASIFIQRKKRLVAQEYITSTTNARKSLATSMSKYNDATRDTHLFAPESIVNSESRSQTNTSTLSHLKPPKTAVQPRSIFGNFSPSKAHNKHTRENQTDDDDATNGSKVNNGKIRKKMSIVESIEAARRELGLPLE